MVVDPDGDPSLAAEPGFHDQTPGGVETVAGPFGHTFGILPVLAENLTKNPFAGGPFMSTQAPTKPNGGNPSFVAVSLRRVHE